MLRDRLGLPNFYEQIKREVPNAQLVHRIDKYTSGVIIVAKNTHSKRILSSAFAQRTVKKFYVAVVAGHPPIGSTLTIDLPLKSGRKSRYRVAGLRQEIRSSREGWSINSEDGFPSITRLRVINRGPKRSLVLCQPITGRTHQIRVHLAWIGHAVVGDPLYGATRSSDHQWDRLLLHAHKISLPDLVYSITSPPPRGFVVAVHTT